MSLHVHRKVLFYYHRFTTAVIRRRNKRNQEKSPCVLESLFDPDDGSAETEAEAGDEEKKDL